MPTRLHGIRILVVDDELDSLEVTRVMLESEGASVLTADTADEALETIRAEPPDVVLCDIAMPEHDGYWLLREIRALPNGGKVAVAALTAHASAATRSEVVRAGFALHITKPADAEALARAVMTLTGTT